MSTVLTTVN